MTVLAFHVQVCGVYLLIILLVDRYNDVTFAARLVV
jgi:hypothetical protein